MPVRMVVPSASGGAASLQAELLAGIMAQSGGPSFIVDHRGGFGREAGESVTARSPADGRTLLLASASMAVRAAAQPANAGFDPVRDLRPLIHLSSTPLVLVVHPAVPANSLETLLALARGSRQRLDAAVSSMIGLDGLAAALVLPPSVAARISTFSGESSALSALTGGQVDAMFVAAPLAVSHVALRRLRPLAKTAASRHPALEKLPVMANPAGDFVREQWYGLFVPAATPTDVVTDLHARIHRVLRAESLVSFFSDHALLHGDGEPGALGALLTQDIARYRALIRRGGLAL